MKSTGTTVGQGIQVELKYCEQCGGLWLRPARAGGVYCGNCRTRLEAPNNVGDPRSDSRRREQGQGITGLKGNQQRSAWIQNQGLATKEGV